MKIDFEFDTPFGLFRDALHLADDHGFTDEEIEMKKGYKPEIEFPHRKEILEAIRCVDEVIPSPWLLDQSFLNDHRIDLLVHGDDNSNQISPEKLLIFPRTIGVSSTALRMRAKQIIEDKSDD